MSLSLSLSLSFSLSLSSPIRKAYRPKFGHRTEYVLLADRDPPRIPAVSAVLCLTGSAKHKTAEITGIRGSAWQHRSSTDHGVAMFEHVSAGPIYIFACWYSRPSIFLLASIAITLVAIEPL